MSGCMAFDFALLAGQAGQCASHVGAVARRGRDTGELRIESEQTFVGRAREKMQGVREVKPVRVAIERLADLAWAFGAEVRKTQQFAQGKVNGRAWQFVGRTQNPLQFQQHGFCDEDAVAVRQQRFGRGYLAWVVQCQAANEDVGVKGEHRETGAASFRGVAPRHIGIQRSVDVGL